MSEIGALSRRELMTGALAGAAFAMGVRPALAAGVEAGAVPVQPLLSIYPDGRIRITALLAEMGQGISTSMPLIMADELDADWSLVEIIAFDSSMAAPPAKDPGMLIAASSRSTRAWFMPLRELAARARAMLVAAAAEQWKAKPEDCRTDKGFVVHPDGKTRLSYGALAGRAAQLPTPTEVRLKSPGEFRLIGKVADRRDVPSKCTGEAIYASDVKLPNMLFASVAQGPLGEKELVGYDEKAALAIPRMRQIFTIEGTTLVAVAEDSWSAMRGLEAAAPQYRLAQADVGSDSYRSALEAALGREGRTWAVKGPPPADPQLKRIEADYHLPFLAHATMEPMSCAAWHKGETCEVWAPTQAVFAARKAAAAAVGLPESAVIIRQTLLGGGFGRRSESDFVRQAAAISKQAKVPIRLVWSRPEDMQHDYYRSAYAMRCRGAVDARGKIADYQVTIAGPSILRGRVPQFSKPDGPIDPTAQNGLVPEHYELPSTGASFVEVLPPIAIGYWRSVAHSQNVFAAESFIDELAHAAGADPFDFRERMLTNARMAAVMAKLRSLSDWGKPMPKGRARGVAVVACYESFFGQVIELSLENGEVRLHRVTNVVDCGLAVQPDNVVAQIEGGAIFGLSAALYGEITFEKGVPGQSSFADYRVLTLAESPRMTTFIIPSDKAPGGVGETGTPTAAPAAANALFALTGKRLRNLPLAKALA
jgi:isoquinoline 1-oxidoreductase beta subunit